VPYIQKAISIFESGAKNWENDPRPRVVAAIAAAREQMNARLEAARVREQPDALTSAARAAIQVGAMLAGTIPADAPMLADRQGNPVAANVLPMRQAQAPSSEKPTLTLGEISKRLEFQVTGAFLHTLGFVPAAKAKTAVLFHEEDFPRMCSALIAHIDSVERQYLKQAA
jgi:hypothetical protein